MIRHLLNQVLHRERLFDGMNVFVTVKDGKAVVNFHGSEPVTIGEGDTLYVGLKALTPTTFRHSASLFNAEVTSPLAEVSRMSTRRRTVASRYLDPDAPLDTPSLDTSFHDREMDI